MSRRKKGLVGILLLVSAPIPSKQCGLPLTVAMHVHLSKCANQTLMANVQIRHCTSCEATVTASRSRPALLRPPVAVGPCPKLFERWRRLPSCCPRCPAGSVSQLSALPSRPSTSAGPSAGFDCSAILCTDANLEVIAVQCQVTGRWGTQNVYILCLSFNPL